MITDHLAIVTWLATGPSGALHLPDSLQVIGIGRFADDGPEWPDGSWRVVCRFDTPPSEHGSPIQARVHFLMDQAPHERIAPGVRFDVCEGRQVVAAVEVLW